MTGKENSGTKQMKEKFQCRVPWICLTILDFDGYVVTNKPLIKLDETFFELC